MKKILIFLVGASLLTGCAHRYDMTLTNGMSVTGVSKPVLDPSSGRYFYTDVAGNKRSVNASHVVEIRPHSSSKSKTNGSS